MTDKNDNGEGPRSKKSKLLDSTSPYYLHPSDTLGLLISSVTLKSEANYREWAGLMRNAFRAKRKLGFVDGTVTKPATNDVVDLEDWWSVNSMMVGWIMTSIDPTIRTQVTLMENVKDLWDDLKQRFSVGDTLRVHQVRDAIRQCIHHGSTGSSISAYYGRLKVLRDELDGYLQPSSCTCGECKCDRNKEFMAQREVEKTHEFLMGLDTALYGTVRSNILSKTPLSSLNSVVLSATTEERHKQVVRDREERADAVGFAVSMSKPHDAKSANSEVALNDAMTSTRPICTHCKKEGHEAKSCFQLHGYPDWWGVGRGRGARGRGRGRGRFNGRGRGTSLVANAAHYPIEANFSGDSHLQAARQQHSSLSTDQWNSLMTLLNSCKPGTSEKLSGPHFEDADWSG